MGLILEKDKLIESFWEYRWWILQNRAGFVATVLHEKQYKPTRGKHKEIQPVDLIRLKKEGLPSYLRDNGLRGYKGVYKWFVSNVHEIDEPNKENPHPLNPDQYTYMFGKNDLRDFQTITEISKGNMGYDHLVKLNFATLTYLSRVQPLTKSTGSKFFNAFRLTEELEFHLMKSIQDAGITNIRNRLKKYVEDDSHYCDEELGLHTFKYIYGHKEEDFVKQLKHFLWKKGDRAKTKEKQTYYWELFEKIEAGHRYKVAEKEAEWHWETANEKPRVLTKKMRLKYLKAIDENLIEYYLPTQKFFSMKMNPLRYL